MMVRKIYFSFHYQDVSDFRANVVRNSGVFRKADTPFRDASIWEEAAEKKVKIIKELIDKSLKGVGVTCVLIGSETYERRWVRYEIIKSFVDKKGMLGVGINWIRGKDGSIKLFRGENPFSYLKCVVSKDGKQLHFFEYKNGWINYRDLPACQNRHFSRKDYGKSFEFTEFYKRYSYSWHNGNQEFPNWVEEAAADVGR